jgi:8-oxo-dGTP diphosphatase
METKDNAKFHIVHVQGWVRHGDKFLMAQRSQKEMQAPGAWHIPGGKVENEVGVQVLEQTLKKEILEEIGIMVSDKMQFLYNDAFVRVDGAHVVSLTFLCDYESGEAQALEDTEKVQWFTLEELKNFVNPPGYLKRAIEKLIEELVKQQKL